MRCPYRGYLIILRQEPNDEYCCWVIDPNGCIRDDLRPKKTFPTMAYALISTRMRIDGDKKDTRTATENKK